MANPPLVWSWAAPDPQGLFELMAAWAVKGCRGRMGLLSTLLM